MKTRLPPHDKMARWRRQISYALRHLDNVIILDSCELAELRLVHALATSEPYADRFKRNGRALQALLLQGCELARGEFSGRWRETLDGILACRNVAALAREWGVDRTKLHRDYWRPVLDFFVEYFLQLEQGAPDAA